MRDSRAAPSRLARLGLGAALGSLIGLFAKELDFTTVVSYHGDQTRVVLGSLALGALVALTPFRPVLMAFAWACAVLWLAVALTPLTHWMGEGLVRRDPVMKADAVFVLGSGLQRDGDLSTVAMSRLLGGLRLLAEGWAPRLVLSELPQPTPRYREAAREIMDSFGMSQEVLVVGPIVNTHDEAVLVGKLASELGFERVLVVTSPSHSRRASAALEAQGVTVVSVPADETAFDYENLGAVVSGDDRVRAFGDFLHEHLGLWYYSMRGWLSGPGGPLLPSGSEGASERRASEH